MRRNKNHHTGGVCCSVFRKPKLQDFAGRLTTAISKTVAVVAGELGDWYRSQVQFAGGTVIMWSQLESSLDAEVCSDLMSGMKSERNHEECAVGV